MPDAVIETPGQYDEARARLAALDAQITALRTVQAAARAERALATLTDADLRDLTPLEDVLADLGYTAEVLRGAVLDWEDGEAFGRAARPGPAAVWFRSAR